MPEPGAARAVSYSVRLYRALLALYPQAHRREYGPLMVQVFRDMCRDAWHTGGHRALAGLWARTVIDLLRTATGEHLAALAQGAPLMIENRPVMPLSW
jgi:hypothetical protein